MATGIDVFFTGLMLICLKGSDCAEGKYYHYPNTAWVVKADGRSMPCGWDSKEVTELVMTFSASDFRVNSWLYCERDECGIGCTTCHLPEGGDICIYPNPKRQPRTAYDLHWLPRIDRIDRRFRELPASRLNYPSYIPTRVHFRNGDRITHGPLWPPNEEKATEWYRSDDLDGDPSPLSDRLKVVYNFARSIKIVYCPTKQHPEILLAELTLEQPVPKRELLAKPTNKRGEVVFQNRTREELLPDFVAKYDNLSYLLWYYRLGWWNTAFGECPRYTPTRRDAVLLCCERANAYESCAYLGPQRNNTFWPPMLAPR